MKKSSLIILLVILAIIIAGGSFYAGMNYSKSAATATRASFSASRGTRTGTAGANFTSGSIIASDSTSITLQLPGSAGSKIIFYTDTTPISKMTSGTSADLTVGTSVSVTGTTNTDGSITAQMIQIRPAGQNLGQNPPAPAQ